jgi:membrane protein
MATAALYRSKSPSWLSAFAVSIGWRELIRRTVKDSIADDALGLAAQLAYYFFLSLFPALLALVALASFFPLSDFTDEMLHLLAPIAPAAVLQVLRDQFVKLSNGDHVGILGFGLLMAIWSSSAAVVSVIEAMNRAYDITEGRPWWKVRLTAIVLTIGLAFFILTSFTLIVAGPQIADFLGRHLGFAPAFTTAWKIVQWPIAFLFVSTGFGIVYYYAPDAEQDWVWITPGAVAATLLWVASSLAFRLYVVNFGNYEEAYGTLGAIILTLLWFYITGFVMVIGAELNAEIEHASPWGKRPGEKEPGKKLRIGLAAAREFFTLQNGSNVKHRPAPLESPSVPSPS